MQNFSSFLNRKNVMVLILTVFFCYSYMFLIFLFIGLNSKIFSNSMEKINSSILDNNIPFCINNLLKERDRKYLNIARTFRNTSLQIYRRQSQCQIQKYTVERTVACLDILNEEQHSNKTKELHFVFMGDSRIRQQFFNFLRFIPDYDKKTDPNPMPFFLHEDMDFTSTVLRLRVSFKWRPLIGKNVTDTIKQWVESPPSIRPYWILLSLEVHHLLKSNGADYGHYLKKITNLGLVLTEFAKFSQVIWLNQYPTIDPTHWDIFSEKIHRYNEGVRSSLKKCSNVQIWDSSNIFAEEYVRSCAVVPQRETAGEYSLQYTACKDFIHTGFAALSFATQLLFNQICNSKFN